MDGSCWIDDFIVYLKADRARSQRTLELYKIALSEFVEHTEALDSQLTWATIDADIVRRWIMALMGSGASVNSVKLRLSALRSFYRYLKLMGRVGQSPMALVQSPKGTKPLPKFFRDDDVNRLLDDLGEKLGEETPEDKHYENHRAYLIILTLYMTGMRVGELVGLNVEDVDLATSQLKVTGKRNKQRVIPMAGDLVTAMRNYLTVRNARLTSVSSNHAANVLHNEPLFVSNKGTRMTASSVQKTVRRLMGMVTTQQKRSPHVFRHTFATSMINNGSDLQSVKELLGHASLSTTEVYTHTNFKELQRVYDEAHPRA